MLDLTTDGFTSGFSKSRSQLGIEFGANMLGLGLGKLGSSFASKSSSLFNQGSQNISIAKSITQSGINSHLNPIALSNLGGSMLNQSRQLGNAATFTLGSVNAADVLGKMIAKENANR